MKKVCDSLHKQWFTLLIVILTLAAFALRVKCCFWGDPVLLHPDESEIVDNAVDMIRRNSWLAMSFDRPDHFEIKCIALIYIFVSKFLYHMPVYEAFLGHIMAFYILARMYVAFFGAALVPLVAGFTGRLMARSEIKVKRSAQLFAAFITAFSSLFIRHGSLATPDIVLTFFVVLFAWGLAEYLDSRNRKTLIMSMVVIGIGLTIKYTAAILCLPLALAVIYREGFLDKKCGNIIRFGFLSIALIVATVFLLAPNLITSFSMVIENFVEEARPNHLGADGLGFRGNFFFYVQEIVKELNPLSLVFFFAGVGYVIAHPHRRLLSLLSGVIYIVCMSVLKLHWTRWGIPLYPFYVIMMAIGVGGFLEFAAVCQRPIRRVIVPLAWMLCALTVGNTFLCGLATVKFCGLPDTCYLALAPLEDMGITRKNTLSEGYTPFAPAWYMGCTQNFTLQDNRLQVDIENASKRYYMKGTGFEPRYRAESERYAEECAIYDAIASQYEVVYTISSDQQRKTSSNILENIQYALEYLTTNYTSAGATITVYDMHPTFVALRTKDGQYLAEGEKHSVALSAEGFSWVPYSVGDWKALISESSGDALDTSGELRTVKASGEVCQQWQLLPVEDCYALINGKNEALTVEQGNVVLRMYTGAENQIWSMENR